MKDLERRLTLWPVVAISISSMLGSGIFVLPGIAVVLTGPGLYLAYLLSAICVLPAAMSKAELATAMPSSGGTYVYLERTFGPLAGTVAGLGLWISLLLKSSFALVGIGAYLTIVADVSLKSTALVLLSLIVLINILGVGKVTQTITVIIIVSIASLLVIAAFGLYEFDSQMMVPIAPHGFEGIVAGAGLVFVSYAGVTKVAAIAEEIKRPQRNLPLGILISLGVVAFFYCLVSYVLLGNIEYQALAGDLRSVHTLSTKLLGTNFGFAIAIIAILTMASMANSGILAASRFPFAMSRDDLLPAVIGRLSAKFLTPVLSIFLSGIVVAIAIISLDVAKIAKLASAFILVIYMSENIAVVVLRETRVRWYNPRFLSPLYPGLQIFGIITTGYLLYVMGAIVPIGLAVVAIPGLILYFVYSRYRTSRLGVLGVRGRRRDLEIPVPEELQSFEGDAGAIVTLFGAERSPEMLVELGAVLAHGEVVEVVHLQEVPEQTDLHDIGEAPREVASLRRRLRAMAIKQNINLYFDHVYSHDLYRTVYEISRQLHCHWLVKEWGGKTRNAFTMHNQMGAIVDHVHCHIVTFRDAGVRYIRNILIYVDTNDLHKVILQTAIHLAEVHEATLTLASFVGHKEPDVRLKEQADALSRLKYEYPAVTNTEIITGTNLIAALVRKTVDFDLLVLRSPKGLNKFERWFGTVQDTIIAKAACSVASIQAYEE
jgi:basic amino acid/polyamine antiporter, APA family